MSLASTNGAASSALQRSVYEPRAWTHSETASTARGGSSSRGGFVASRLGRSLSFLRRGDRVVEAVEAEGDLGVLSEPSTLVVAVRSGGALDGTERLAEELLEQSGGRLAAGEGCGGGVRWPRAG